jgi:hypothetical protein
MKANEILRQAAVILEERGKVRDSEDGERSIARAVTAYKALRGPTMDTVLDGWLFMAVLKLARATAGEAHVDDYQDLAGYAALAAECLSEGVEKPDGNENPWIPHDPQTAEGCPVPPDTYVIVKLRDGRIGAPSIADDWGSLWKEHRSLKDWSCDIVAYQIVSDERLVR